VGKTVLIQEMITRVAKKLRRRLGVRRGGRADTVRVTDLLVEMTESNVIKDTALVFGQMDEPPGVRLRVGLSALTMAEYFRDVQGQDGCCSSTTSSGSPRRGRRCPRCSAGCPRPVGYQPTLADEMGQLQERITSTRGHSITSMQAIYVPADDYTDPAPATTFAHLDATTALSRAITEKGIFPGPWTRFASTSRILGRQVHRPGALRFGPARCSGSCSGTRSSRTSSRWLGIDELFRGRPGDGQAQPRRIERFLSHPHVRRRAVHRPSRACSCLLEETIASFKAINEGKYDNYPEQAFFMCGGIEDVEKKAKEIEERQ